MSKTMCARCGKILKSIDEHYYCPDCAKKVRQENVVKLRTCVDCGMEFYGGPRAKRCPECSLERRRFVQNEQQKRGVRRPLGTKDYCELCGSEYIVRSGLQKYCSDQCQHKAGLLLLREYKSKNNVKYRSKRKERRANKIFVCEYCSKKFKRTQANKSTVYCSDFCRKEQHKLRQCIHDINRGYNRDYDKYLAKREEYRALQASINQKKDT